MKRILLSAIAMLLGAVPGAVFATTAFATPPFSTNESLSSCTQPSASTLHPKVLRDLTVPGVGVGMPRTTNP